MPSRSGAYRKGGDSKTAPFQGSHCRGLAFRRRGYFQFSARARPALDYGLAAIYNFRIHLNKRSSLMNELKDWQDLHAAGDRSDELYKEAIKNPQNADARAAFREVVKAVKAFWRIHH